MHTVLVTGCTGHIGSHVARAAFARGWTVRGLVRPRADRRALQDLPVELVEGDILQPDSLAAAMEGVDLVLHVAAAHRNWAADEQEILGPAVQGTEHVLAAARAAGVPRVVCTSSAATVGFAADPAHPLDESHTLEHAQAVYTRAKLHAERVALAAGRSGDQPEVVVVNPSGVFGPGDHRLTPATRALVGLLQGDPAFLAVSVTDVRDVAEGHLQAAELGRSGQRYLLTGEVLTPAALAELLAELSGTRPPTFRPPRWVLSILAGRAEARARKTGQDAPITRGQVADVHGRHLAYDSSRARRELDWHSRPARETLLDALRWLLHVEALKPAVAARVREQLGEAAAPDPDWPPTAAPAAG